VSSEFSRPGKAGRSKVEDRKAGRRGSKTGCLDHSPLIFRRQARPAVSALAERPRGTRRTRRRYDAMMLPPGSEGGSDVGYGVKVAGPRLSSTCRRNLAQSRDHARRECLPEIAGNSCGLREIGAAGRTTRAPREVERPVGQFRRRFKSPSLKDTLHTVSVGAPRDVAPNPPPGRSLLGGALMSATVASLRCAAEILLDYVTLTAR